MDLLEPCFFVERVRLNQESLRPTTRSHVGHAFAIQYSADIRRMCGRE